MTGAFRRQRASPGPADGWQNSAVRLLPAACGDPVITTNAPNTKRTSGLISEALVSRSDVSVTWIDGAPHQR